MFVFVCCINSVDLLILLVWFRACVVLDCGDLVVLVCLSVLVVAGCWHFVWLCLLGIVVFDLLLDCGVYLIRLVANGLLGICFGLICWFDLVGC